MAISKAENNRLQRVEDGLAFANMIDDMRKFDVATPNRKKKLLCYSLILFEVLMWETFIEDLVEEGQEFMLAHINDPKKFGFDVLLPVSALLCERKDKRVIWDIAGDQWKSALRAHRKELIEGFHTPRPDKIDALVVETLGLKNLSDSWRWKNAPNARVKQRMNDLITMRGGIAHSMVGVPTVHFQTFISRLSFARRACDVSANRVRDHIHSIVGHYPWDEA
ncbi:MAG: hypothetical protein NTV51_09850 [Verrucomicrobia bacterium]|nr:hypothetical protein [Verrucomicrobiota bacterium]